MEVLEQRSLLSASVSTDALDYAPGQTIGVSGSGYAVGESIILSVLLNGQTEVARWTITDGGTGDADGAADGSFTTSVLCGNWEDTFNYLTATGLTSAASATTLFFDSGEGSPPNITAQNGWLEADVGDQQTYTITAPAGSTITKIGIKTGSGGTFPIENLTGVVGDANTSEKHSPVIIADGTYSGYLVTGIGTGSVTVTNVGASQGRGISHIDYFLDDEDTNDLLGSISGRKFEDKNGDSLLNGTDAGILGWVIALDDDNNPNNGVITTVTTDASGSFTFDDLSPGTYYVREVQQSGWTQTRGGPLVNGSYQVTVIAGQNATGANFGNFKNVTLTGKKFYDANGNGLDDDGQVVKGFKIGLSVDGDDSDFEYFAFTDANGNYAFGDLDNADGDNNPLTGSDLAPGTYFVQEILPPAGWIQTFGATGYTITVGGDGIQSGGVSSGNDFGNLALGGGGGHTLGFWSNKNGQATMGDGGSDAPELAMLNALNLKDANGADVTFANYKAFRTWLLNGTATNMKYMLSVQLAAMSLNVEAGFVSGTATIYAPGLGAGGTDFISINSLMSQANTALADPSATRPVLEGLKNALDGANNNLNFVLPTPPAVVY